MKQRKRQTIHTFKIASLIDPEGVYEAVCCAMTGEILHHTSNGKLFEQPQEEEEVVEIKNVNQLSIF